MAPLGKIKKEHVRILADSMAGPECSSVSWHCQRQIQVRILVESTAGSENVPVPDLGSVEGGFRSESWKSQQ